jgi:thioredoxin reductase
MAEKNQFDVIIIGGSYSGLAAGMALGRALRKVLIIDSGKPCNRQTPHSHNFITQDGKTPKEIAASARAQVEKYETVQFLHGTVSGGVKNETGFEISTEKGEKFSAKKLVFATGISDTIPPIPGFAECWGISVLHCPYCHGYEVRNKKTGIIGNGDAGFEFATMISNWTKDLALYTNGKSTLTEEQTKKLQQHNIRVIETEIKEFSHDKGIVQNIILKDGSKAAVEALYVRCAFTQHCTVPESLGCELTQEGFIKTEGVQKTTVAGVFACGDNVSPMRTVANAVALGTAAGMMANREIIFEEF